MADNIAKIEKKIKIDITTVKIIGHNKIYPSTNYELLLPFSIQLRKPSDLKNIMYEPTRKISCNKICSEDTRIFTNFWAKSQQKQSS